MEVHRDWLRLLEELFTAAQAAGDFDKNESPAQLAFELDGHLLMANMVFVLHNDEGALDRARRAIEGRIAVAAAQARRSGAPV